MATYEIPLTPEAQTFTINLGGTAYKMVLLWNSVSSNWNLDMYVNGTVPLLRGIPLVPNVNLFGQFPYFNFGGQLMCQTDDNSNSVPNYNNLGSTSHLYFTTS